MPTTELPGYRVIQGAQVMPEEELRNDVAAFLGRTDRGPLGVPVRVAGRRAYAAVFGRPLAGASTPRAVDAYFANDGEVAWVVRTGTGGSPAVADADLGAATGGVWDAGGPVRLSLPGTQLHVEAASPGTWAQGTTIVLTYRAYGLTGAPELDVRIEVPGEAVVQRAGLAAEALVDAIGATGLLAARLEGEAVAPPPGPASGPSSLTWTLTLGGGADPVATAESYRTATIAQAQIEEIALLSAPDLAGDLGAADHDDLVGEMAASAATAQDRLLILTGPSLDPSELGEWRARIAVAVPDASQQRAVAAYAPPLMAEDLARGSVDRYRPTNPVGHVCGVIAHLDRTRGSGWAPANVLVTDAIDVVGRSTDGEQLAAVAQGVNLLRCRPGGGLEVWGARTLDPGDGRHIPHRRLIHRLVRAIRRATEPLVFDTNGPILWLGVLRAVSGELLDAFRSGFLQGDSPEQAYRVRCDETTNTPDRIDAGQVVCEIEIAPAAPMEFITLRLTLGAEGLLEVVER